MISWHIHINNHRQDVVWAHLRTEERYAQRMEFSQTRIFEMFFPVRQISSRMASRRKPDSVPSWNWPCINDASANDEGPSHEVLREDLVRSI